MTFGTGAVIRDVIGLRELSGRAKVCLEKEKGTLSPVLVEPRRGEPSLALQLQMGVFEEGPSRTPGMHWVRFYRQTRDL